MGTALAQYFGFLSSMDCVQDIWVAGAGGWLLGFVMCAGVNYVIGKTKNSAGE